MTKGAERPKTLDDLGFADEHKFYVRDHQGQPIAIIGWSGDRIGLGGCIEAGIRWSCYEGAAIDMGNGQVIKALDPDKPDCMEDFDEVLERFRSIGKFGQGGHVELVSRHPDRMKIQLWTRYGRYTVVAVKKEDKPMYLLGFAHERDGGGRDISEGDANEATVQKILEDILSFELVKHHQVQT